jgi:hypothetical protein
LHTNIFNLFKVVVVSPQILKVLPAFVEPEKLSGGFGLLVVLHILPVHTSPHGDLLFDREVFEGLRDERQLPEDLCADRARCGSECEQPVDA